MNLFIYAIAFFAIFAIVMKLDNVLFHPKRQAKRLKDEILKYWLIDDSIAFNEKVTNPLSPNDVFFGYFKTIHPIGIICEVYFWGAVGKSLVVIPYSNIRENRTLEERRTEEKKKKLKDEYNSEQEVLKMYVNLTDSDKNG